MHEIVLEDERLGEQSRGVDETPAPILPMGPSGGLHSHGSAF